jgi:hypothetical protein
MSTASQPAGSPLRSVTPDPFEMSSRAYPAVPKGLTAAAWSILICALATPDSTTAGARCRR